MELTVRRLWILQSEGASSCSDWAFPCPGATTVKEAQPPAFKEALSPGETDAETVKLSTVQ